MKILIAGGGKVGRTLTSELSAEGHDITLIDRNPRVLEETIEKYDVITLAGNSGSMKTLEEAGIRDMDIFIAATNADEVNLLSCLSARTLNPNIHTIARIRDPEYVDQALKMREIFSLSLVINPEKQAAGEIAKLLKYPGFLKRESFAKARVEIVELKVRKGSRIANVQLSNLESRVRSKVLVCAVVRNNKAIMPDGSFVLQEGDKIYVTGKPAELHNMLIQTGVINMPVRNVFITGAGRITYYLAEELGRSHIHCTIIDNNFSKCLDMSARLPEATVINGDVSDYSVLEAEEIDKYNAVVSLTGMDELNIITSLYANISKVPQIVTKLGRGESSELVDSLPIGSTICPKELCTMHIVRYVRAMQNKTGQALTIHRIADGNAEAIEFLVDSSTRHIGEAFKDVRIKKNILVVSVGIGNNTNIPNGNTSYKEGDTVVIVTDKNTVVNSLNDIFED
ncbi:MAG: Trk system potassium transporter TrkA [Solobacterium sp.]|nr:Trk system potassium transporter TrkA [Solobacterium sp.]